MNQPEAINQALATLYPDASAELDYTSPFELLIATVLAGGSALFIAAMAVTAFGHGLANVAGMGVFSSDRTIREYADEIWHVKPLKK